VVPGFATAQPGFARAEPGLNGGLRTSIKEHGMEAFDRLKAAVVAAEADVIKAEGGNKAAGTRVRKAMQDIKKVAQEVRIKVLETRT
jgi:hypothetical protein